MHKNRKTENSVTENIKINDRLSINSNSKINILYELKDRNEIIGLIFLKLKVKKDNNRYFISKIEAKVERNPYLDSDNNSNIKDYLVNSSISALKLSKTLLKDYTDYRKTTLDIHYLINRKPDNELEVAFDILLKINDTDVDKIYLEFKKDKENHCKSRLTFIKNLKQLILSDKNKEYKIVNIEYEKIENGFSDFIKNTNKVIFVGSLAFLTFNLVKKTVTDVIDSMID